MSGASIATTLELWAASLRDIKARILCGGQDIARHPRSYALGAFVADPLHYLALIEMKPNALDQAAALQGWNLPEVFQHLRHLLEARMGIVTSNLPFEDWTSVLGSERLTGALLDRLTHHVSS